MKGLSKGRYDETFSGEDEEIPEKEEMHEKQAKIRKGVKGH